MSSLSVVEEEVVSLFVGVADALALPRSVGELYGLLFVSEEPLCMADCMAKLDISKGSVSQGLKTLRAFSAVKIVRQSDSRKDFFVAETEMRKMIGGFVKERVKPRLNQGSTQIKTICATLKETDSSNTVVGERLNRLAGWHWKFEKSLPLALKLMGE